MRIAIRQFGRGGPPCDICTPCCACAISMPRSTSIATSSASKEARRVDEKGRYTLVFLAAPEDEALVEDTQEIRPRRAAGRAHL